MGELNFIFDFVIRATWNVWPAFLISILLGVLVKALKLDGTIRRAFSARIGLAILLATLVGAFSPFCSCTVIPVVSGLLLGGVPLAPVMAFWIASPTMDPEILALSVATIGWPLSVARLAATLAISLGAGYVTLALTRGGLIGHPLRAGSVTPKTSPSVTARMAVGPVPMAAIGGTLGVNAATLSPVTVMGSCTGSSCSLATGPGARRPDWWQELIQGWQTLQWGEVGHDVLRQSWNLGRWLLLAFVLEALILLYVPQAAIAKVLGQQNPLAVPMAAFVGIPLYLNNISALPIVSGLLAQGMQPGAAIAFLVAGPVTTIPAMTAVWGIARREVFALYLAVGLVGALVAGIVTNVLL